jgi:hypothetical protein
MNIKLRNVIQKELADIKRRVLFNTKNDARINNTHSSLGTIIG